MIFIKFIAPNFYNFSPYYKNSLRDFSFLRGIREKTRVNEFFSVTTINNSKKTAVFFNKCLLLILN